jgi:diguanylate cyclase (GGDEF)-like protein
MEFNIDSIEKYLSQKEKNEIEKKGIKDCPEIINLLLKRIPPENIKELVTILKLALTPSIYIDVNEEKENLLKQLEEDPSLLLSIEIQKKLEEFINDRFENDKRVLVEKTNEISEFIHVMEEHLNDAINSSGTSSNNVSSIKEKLEGIELQKNDNQLREIKDSLFSAANNFQDEMSSVSKKLEKDKSHVSQLENKVKELENELLKTKEESMRDHLTGLLTRRAFESEMRRIESAYERNNNKYAVVFFDIDFFKNVNDTYGHEGGDIILSTFAKILDKSTRTSDIVGRYGGEEFVSIVHYNLNTELDQYLKRVKDIVTLHSFKYNEHKIKITFSAGVTLRSEHKNFAGAIQKADMLLYEAKENGRNQIRLEDGRVI